MKFFIIVLTLIALSNSLFLNWVYPYGVQDTLEPSHQLYYQYSKRQSLLPKNAFPNISSPILEIPVEEGGKNGLLISSQKYLGLMTEGILHACEYGRCLLPLSISEHFRYHIFGSGYHDTFPEYHLLTQGVCTLLPIQYDNLNYLLNENCSGIEPFSKFKTFIETEVSAMKLQGFNL